MEAASPAGLWSPGRSTVTAVVSRGRVLGCQHAGPRPEAGLGHVVPYFHPHAGPHTLPTTAFS